MNDIIEARQAIQTALLTAHPRIYYENAPSNAVYPFIVFNFPNSVYDGANTGSIVLEVDGWDKSKTSTNLETLMYNVNAVLDRKTVNVDLQNLTWEQAEKTWFFANFPWNGQQTQSLGIVVYLDSKLSIPDTDTTIIRRKYSYNLKTIQGR